MTKVAITCNGTDPTNLYPTFLTAVAALMWECEVVLFFHSAAAPALRPGYLEGLPAEGSQEMAGLVRDFTELGGQIMACELAGEIHGLGPEDYRAGVEVAGVVFFFSETCDADLTYSF